MNDVFYLVSFVIDRQKKISTLPIHGQVYLFAHTHIDVFVQKWELGVFHFTLQTILYLLENSVFCKTQTAKVPDPQIKQTNIPWKIRIQLFN